MLYAFILGIVVINIIVPYLNEKDKRKVTKLSESVKDLLASLRKSVSNELEPLLITPDLKEKGVKDLKLNIRIFVPKNRTITEIWNKQRSFIMKDHSGLNVRPIDDLTFTVKPPDKAQGLVGQVYKEKRVKYDFDLEANRANTYYKLEPNQLDKTNYCRFAIAAPIFKKNTQDIIALVSFDSEVKISPPITNEWEDVIRTYCKIVHKSHRLLRS